MKMYLSLAKWGPAHLCDASCQKSYHMIMDYPFPETPFSDGSKFKEFQTKAENVAMKGS